MTPDSLRLFIAVGFALRRNQWFMGWFLGSLVAPVVLSVAQLVQPTAFFMVALVVGTLWSMGASAAGLLIAMAIRAGKKKERERSIQ